MGNSPSSPKRSSSARPNAPLRNATGNATLRFRAIQDNYRTIDEVQEALRSGGLESSQLIVAFDFTKSNEWTGKYSFGGRSLHQIGQQLNPYEEAATVIGRTLSAFDDDGLIQAYGFGDATTGDRQVFSFYPNDQPCPSIDSVAWRYRELVPHIRLAGPTSFAPAIRQAMDVVARSGGQYHILLIIADGQVTRSSELSTHERSDQERETIQAIVQASKYPMSIILVGVGDGPWDLMQEFDDLLPQRDFDNFQFVNYSKLAAQEPNPQRREAAFALRALMEIPEQYKTIQRLHLMNKRDLPRLGRPRDPPGPPPAPIAQQAFMPQQPSAPSAAAPPPAINHMFLCPITQDVMREPVIAADGYTYERAAIEDWLRTHDTSPMTNARVPHKNLIPNHNLRSTIMEAHPHLR